MDSLIDEKRHELTAVKALRWAYIVAFLSIAVITIGSHVLFDRWLKAEEMNGHVVNLAGRQRMLSERILRLTLSRSDDVRLSKSVEEFTQAHRELFGGAQPASGVIPPSELENAYVGFLSQVDRSIERVASSSLGMSQLNYVSQMEDVVDSLGRRAEVGLQRVRRLTRGLAAMLLLVLLLEAALIFRPLVKSIEARTVELIEANQALSASKSELEKSHQDLSRANSELGQFSFAASHDLREPLRNTSLCLQLLEEELKGKLDTQSEFLLRETALSNERMKGILEGLESLLPGTEEESECSVRQAVAKALENLSPVLSEREAEVSVQIDDFLLRSHAQQLVRLFQNLISNAVKDSREGVKPGITVWSVESGSETRVYVKDNGLGIPQDQFERIFEPFRRLHRQNQVLGSGLGLNFCQAVVSRLGGKIWVSSSSIGEGSTFTMSLPRSIEKES